DRIIQYGIMDDTDTSVSENSWTVELLSILLKTLCSKARMANQKMEGDVSVNLKIEFEWAIEDRPGHKVDYDLMWCDENKREWELAIPLP
ncbi:10756_t:CDS:2, partial [Paraglomus occultum]